MTGLSIAAPADIGLNARQVSRANSLLESWSSTPDAPVKSGAILMGRHGRCLEPRYFGRQGPLPNDPPIRTDAIFLLASITKPVTYMAGLMLMERGLLNLSDPVTRYIPEFAVCQKERTLVLHLFTHTSGLPDMLPANVAMRQRHAPIGEFIQGAIQASPLFSPGTDFRYQSMGTLVVAEILQRLTGESIQEFIRKQILDPLKMESTGLGSQGLDADRIVRVEERRRDRGSDYGWNSRYWREFGAPWGGLFSTPTDFAVLCQLILNKGTMDGVRLLSPNTVRAMCSNRLLDLPDFDPVVARTRPWGLGWSLNHRGTDESWGSSLGPNVIGHSGATGTLCWIDPDRDAFCLIFTTATLAKARHRLVHLSNVMAAAIED